MTQSSLQPHISVLLTEVLASLSPKEGGVYVDGTFGVGGYTKGILDAAPNVRVIAVDRDPAARKHADALAVRYAERLAFVESRFSQMDDVLRGLEIAQVDGIVLDLGVSSPQLDEAARGFSFRKEGPLDMRMGLCAVSAADVVNTFEEEEIARILFVYGEERYARRIARRIVEVRKQAPIMTTTALSDIVRMAMPPHARHGKIDPSTRTFQGLRIYVNEELSEIEVFLKKSIDLLREGGRLVIVSFHSLEDRLVKHFFKDNAVKKDPAPHLPWHSQEGPEPVFTLLTKKSVTPSEQELATNPRSRSARLRAVEKKVSVPCKK
jgi:16S rRNA (cytosine1402-N4)-methyltransferase